MSAYRPIRFTRLNVAICHRPPGNPNNTHRIIVGSSAVKAHIAHGDKQGKCDNEKDGKDKSDESKEGNDDEDKKGDNKDDDSDKAGKIEKNNKNIEHNNEKQSEKARGKDKKK